MAWTWYDSTITKIVDESPNTKRFWLKPNSNIPEFKAGQFVTMDLPISEKRLKRWRSYSIANAPGVGNELEFCIVNLEGGLASQYFFNEAEVGTAIKFKGPTGAFYLKDEIKNDLVLICTGTGVAPFRSMLLDIFSKEKPYKNIHLIFGTRHAEGILYKEEFIEMQKQNENFKYSVALSRDSIENIDKAEFNIYSGYIHQIYKSEYSSPQTNIDFYLCGWSNMVDEAVDKLTNEMGYKKEQVHFELYG